MTNEQAKEILRCNTDLGNGVIIENESTQEIYEALKMAIKALEQDVTDTNVGKIDSDCVSRQALLEFVESKYQSNWWNVDEVLAKIKALPPVTPTHGTCKDCKHYYMDEDGHGYHCEKFDYTRFPVYADFYCADYEKRGNENG